MDEETPMVAFGNNELAHRPLVIAGDRVRHDGCDEAHVLEQSTQVREDGSEAPSDVLLFFRCGKTACLGALKGALLPRLERVREGT